MYNSKFTIIKLQQEGIMEGGSINDYPLLLTNISARSNGLGMF